MKRLLLLAATTGYQTRVFADAARELDIEPVLATDRCHVLDDPWGDQAIPIRFDDPVSASARIAEEGRRRPFHAIVAVADRPTFLAALAAEKLHMPYNSPASIAASRNKHCARELFQLAGLPIPSFFRVPLESDARDAAQRAPFPCVLKPLGLSASRGVIRANNIPEFISAFERIKALLETPDILMFRDDADRYIQIESFIEGREYALEGLLTGGRLQILAVFDKPDPLEGPFFEETIYVTPSRAEPAVQQCLIDATQRAVHALGLTRGPVHAELRYNTHGAWMLEIAARPIGGLCGRALRFNADVSLEELILRHALGEDVSRAQLSGPSGVMMIPISHGGIYEGVAGVDRAQSVAGVVEVIITAKEGQKLTPLPEGASYLGFIFARGGSPREVEDSLRDAHRCLRFEIATALPVLR